MFHRQQLQVRIRPDGRVIVNRERDQRIVLGLHQQRGNADALQELIGRLRCVVVVSSAEAKRLGREPVVEIVDVSNQIQAGQVEYSRREPLLGAYAFLESGNKSSRIDQVGRFVELADAGR